VRPSERVRETSVKKDPDATDNKTKKGKNCKFWKKKMHVKSSYTERKNAGRFGDRLEGRIQKGWGEKRALAGRTKPFILGDIPIGQNGTGRSPVSQREMAH